MKGVNKDGPRCIKYDWSVLLLFYKENENARAIVDLDLFILMLLFSRNSAEINYYA